MGSWGRPGEQSTGLGCEAGCCICVRSFLLLSQLRLSCVWEDAVSYALKVLSTGDETEHSKGRNTMHRSTLQFGLLNARSQAGPLSQAFLLHCSTACQNSGFVLCATLVSQHLHGFPLQATVQLLLMPAPSHLVPAAFQPPPCSPLFCFVNLSTSAGVQLIPNQLPGSESSVRTEIITDRHLPLQLPNLHSPPQLC